MVPIDSVSSEGQLPHCQPSSSCNLTGLNGERAFSETSFKMASVPFMRVEPDHLLSAPLPNITLGVRISIHEFWEDKNTQFTATPLRQSRSAGFILHSCQDSFRTLCIFAINYLQDYLIKVSLSLYRVNFTRPLPKLSRSHLRFLEQYRKQSVHGRKAQCMDGGKGGRQAVGLGCNFCPASF